MPHCWKSHDIAHIISRFTLLPCALCVQCHCNYAIYVPVYLMTLINLFKTHPGCKVLLEQNGFSVSMTNVPRSRNAVDTTIERTINRHAKSQGGILWFSRNYAAYYRDFPTCLKLGPGACWILEKKNIWTIRIGKLWCSLKELDSHIKWIINNIRNWQCKTVTYLLL